MLSSERSSERFFLVLAGGIYTAALVAFAHNGRTDQMVSLGFALDLALTIPFLAYLLPVRRAGWPLLSLPALALLGLTTVLLLGPDSLPALLRSPELVLVGLECTLLGSVILRTVRAWRHAAGADSLDALGRLQIAAREVVPLRRAADALAHELAVFYYAIFAWRARPSVPPDALAVSYHRRSGYGGIIVAVLLLCTVEGVAVHLLVAGWSVAAAWALTILTAYGTLILAADYRASVLRPVLVTSEALSVRIGLRWSMTIPRTQIASVQRKAPAGAERVLNATLLNNPSLWIQLREPGRAHGLYGMTREVQWIALGVDAPDVLATALAADRSA